MDKTLTLRLDKTQDAALARRAKALGTTRSALVRDLIDKAVSDSPIGRRTGHLKGRIELPQVASEWRRQLRDRNWR